jgi:molybdopterin/thiamine biosynthesis adenylyltransferase
MNEKSIVVAGAGGNIGSHVTGLLARMPEVGRVVLIDRDVYEARNLVNQDIAERDVGKPKVFVQARRLAEIRPNLNVRAIHAPLESLPLGAWRADLIVACLDSRAARQTVNERAWRLSVPWIDSGVMASESLARVNVYASTGDAPCLECAWSKEDYDLMDRLYSCAGEAANAPAPNGAPSELGALAAAMLALECRKMLAGEIDGALIGRQATLNARWHQHAVTRFLRNSRCRFDHAAWRIEPLPCSTERMRIADLLAMAAVVRVPGHRFIRCLVCSGCGEERRLFRLDSSLDAAMNRCGACRKTMTPAGFDIVESLSGDLPEEVLNRTMNDVGLRYGDVIRADDRYFEIAADAVMAN